MIATNNEIFESNEFALQIIAKGSFDDSGSGDGKSYRIETIVLRMNHVALDDWMISTMLNCRECFETDPEWKAYEAKCKRKREAVEAQIMVDLSIRADDGSTSIAQSQSEVFTVVHISEIDTAEPPLVHVTH